jgi:hypothetical protein
MFISAYEHHAGCGNDSAFSLWRTWNACHNADITAVFTEIADLLEIQGEYLPIRAYRRRAHFGRPPQEARLLRSAR